MFYFNLQYLLSSYQVYSVSEYTIHRSTHYVIETFLQIINLSFGTNIDFFRFQFWFRVLVFYFSNFGFSFGFEFWYLFFSVFEFYFEY